MPIDDVNRGFLHGANYEIIVDSSCKALAVQVAGKVHFFDLESKRLRWKASVLYPGSIQFRDGGAILDSCELLRIKTENWEQQPYTYSVRSLSTVDGSLVDYAFQSTQKKIEPKRIDVLQIDEIIFFGREEFYHYIKCVKYFSSGHRVAIVFPEAVEIWRRTRNYGWLGLLELPLTWIVLISFGALNVLFVRWVRARRRVSLQAG
ncbi:MAG: hypothetical protein WCT04_14010 [Planctomycetota bacterium]